MIVNIFQSQFFILAVHSVNNIKMQCDFPIWLSVFLFIYAFTLAALFLNFYFKTYKKERRSDAKVQKLDYVNGHKNSHYKTH